MRNEKSHRSSASVGAALLALALQSCRGVGAPTTSSPAPIAAATAPVPARRSTPTSSPNTQGVTAARNHEFELTLSTSEHTYSLGEPVDLVAAVKNISSRFEEMYVGDPLRMMKVAVLRPDGSAAPLTEYGEQLMVGAEYIHSGGINPIPPGESYSTTFELSALFDMREEGPYRITVTCNVPSRYRPDGVQALTANVQLLIVGHN